MSQQLHEKIRDLWRFAAEKLGEFDVQALQRDLPIIQAHAGQDPSTYIHKVSHSSGIYLQLLQLSERISKFIILRLDVDVIPMDIDKDYAWKADPNVNLKAKLEENLPFLPAPGHSHPMLLRVNLVLTSLGNPQLYPLIEKMVEISREFKLPDDYLIVTYTPEKPDKAPFIPYHNNILPLVRFRYALIPHENTSYGKREHTLYIILEKDFISQFIHSREDVNELQNNFVVRLEELFGEYPIAVWLKDIVIKPEDAPDLNSCIQGATIRNAAGLIDTLYTLFDLKKIPACQLCGLMQYNTPVQEYIIPQSTLQFSTPEESTESDSVPEEKIQEIIAKISRLEAWEKENKPIPPNSIPSVKETPNSITSVKEEVEDKKYFCAYCHGVVNRALTGEE